jgi:hypothetical protein
VNVVNGLAITNDRMSKPDAPSQSDAWHVHRFVYSCDKKVILMLMLMMRRAVHPNAPFVGRADSCKLSCTNQQAS